jgi:hypothetical protein
MGLDRPEITGANSYEGCREKGTEIGREILQSTM